MSSIAPVPEGLTPGLRPLYDEAMAIADQSPASACALLRLVLRSVLTSAGQPGRDLARDIDAATMGAPPVLRALDAIGLSRDASRRPGELDLSQGHSDVQNLVVLVTLIVGHLSPGSTPTP